MLLILTVHATESTADPRGPIRFMVGRWEGAAKGEPGIGSVTRRYEYVQFVLNPAETTAEKAVFESDHIESFSRQSLPPLGS